MTKFVLVICLLLMGGCGTIPKEGTNRNTHKEGTINDRSIGVEEELFYILNEL